MLRVDPPKRKLDPFAQGEETARFVEHVILEAERQIRGVDRGPERLEAASDVVLRSIILPSRESARLTVQVLYNYIARDLPDHLRSLKTELPSTQRTD